MPANREDMSSPRHVDASRCASELGADGAARHPYPVHGRDARPMLEVETLHEPVGWHTPGSDVSMNKGKPSGFEAETKKDAGVRSTSYERRGQAGAGPEWTERKRERDEQKTNPGGEGGPEQNAGGPRHRGAGAHEDRNP